MKNIKIKFLIIIGIIFTAFILARPIFSNNEIPQAESVSVKTVASEILATGSIKSKNEVNLHFQTGGKLVYLPFKEGDRVFKGQTIARLDTYALQRQLNAALNNYRITRNTFDQTQDNANKGVLNGAQKYNLQMLNKGGFEVADVIGDIIKRILDQNQATLDNSVINVELANYAVQLATLNSPIDGIIYHLDVNIPNTNITPTTSFAVIDPNALIFRANVSENNIEFINVGSITDIQLDAYKDKKFQGVVTKIYPGKITLPNGQHVYQVDIECDEFTKQAKYDQAGSAIIKSNADKNMILIPAWTILSNKNVWVLENDKPVLKEIKTGKTYGKDIEVLEGLSSSDKIVINPKYLLKGKYKFI